MSSFHPSSLLLTDKKKERQQLELGGSSTKTLLAQANGIRNLRALVATQSGDTHLRHDLPWWNKPSAPRLHPMSAGTSTSSKRRPFTHSWGWDFFWWKKATNSLHQLQFLHHFCPGENDERGSTSNQPERISICRRAHGLTSWVTNRYHSVRILSSIYMSIDSVRIGGDGDVVSLFHVPFLDPWRLSCCTWSWRFGSDHFPFQMGDGCRFQPLIFQGVSILGVLCLSEMPTQLRNLSLAPHGFKRFWIPSEAWPIFILNVLNGNIWSQKIHGQPTKITNNQLSWKVPLQVLWKCVLAARFFWSSATLQQQPCSQDAEVPCQRPSGTWQNKHLQTSLCQTWQLRLSSPKTLRCELLSFAFLEDFIGICDDSSNENNQTNVNL